MTIHAEIIFADDIRSEDNGKQILIGVYSEALIPGTLPQTPVLALWMRLLGMPMGEYEVDVDLKFDGQSKVKVKMAVTVADEERPLTLTVRGIPVPIDRPGALVAELSSPKLGVFATAKLPVWEVPENAAATTAVGPA